MRSVRLVAPALVVLTASWACGGGGPAVGPSPGAPAPAGPTPTPRVVLHIAKVRGTELSFVERGSGIPAERAALLRTAFELRLELAADPAAYMPALSCGEVGGIRSPVLLVTGERSPRLFHVLTEELARCLPAEENVTVPGAGHAVHGDNPAYYNAAVLQFLMKN